MGILNFFYKAMNKHRIYRYRSRLPGEIKLLAILRIRNEELIIEDTLNHLSQFCDAIICFDDSSTDHTFDIIKEHSKVIAIIRNFNWLKNADQRIICETTDRYEMLKLAKEYCPDWIICADADERYLGDIKEFLSSDKVKNIDAIRISLFDAYMTENDQKAFSENDTLLNYRTFFGIERRDIIMIWKNHKDIDFRGTDSREPIIPDHLNVIVKFYCQHYGKSLSFKHWEDTCDYYINHFPYDPYGKKWSARKGKAVHLLSDFETALYPWGEQLFTNAIVIHPGG
jgi:hypothetical protein